MNEEIVIAIRDIPDERIEKIITETDRILKSTKSKTIKKDATEFYLSFRTAIKKKSEIKNNEFILRSKIINENKEMLNRPMGEYTFKINVFNKTIIPFIIHPFASDYFTGTYKNPLLGNGLGAMIEARLIKRILNMKVNKKRVFQEYYYHNTGMILEARARQLKRYGVGRKKIPINEYLEIVEKYIRKGYWKKIYPKRKIEIEQKRKAYQEKIKRKKQNRKTMRK